MGNEIVFTFNGLVSAYIIGSFPSSYIVARLRKGVDIRQVGSRNMGAMNVFYVVGFWWGMLALGLDIGKGALAVALARWLGAPLIGQFLAGAMVLIGHSFPVFLRFRGGRGGASVIGVMAYLMPWSIPIYLGSFLLLMWITRFPTLSYGVAFVVNPFIGWLIYHSAEFVIYSSVILLIPLIRYMPRIKEMRSKSGGWGHFFMRKGLKDRF